MQIPRIRQDQAQRLKRQAALGRALIRFRGPFVPGWLHLRYTECRKGGCKCTKGEPHGPFLYATLLLKGKKVYRYVGKPSDAALARRIKNYQEFREKLAEFRRLHREMEVDWKRLEHSPTKRPTK